MSHGVKIALIAGLVLVGGYLVLGGSSASALVPAGTPTGLALSPSPGAPTAPPSLSRTQAVGNLTGSAENLAVQSSLFVVTGGLSSSTVRGALVSGARSVGGAVKSGATTVYHDLGAIF